MADKISKPPTPSAPPSGPPPTAVSQPTPTTSAVPSEVMSPAATAQVESRAVVKASNVQPSHIGTNLSTDKLVDALIQAYPDRPADNSVITGLENSLSQKAFDFVDERMQDHRRNLQDIEATGERWLYKYATDPNLTEAQARQGAYNQTYGYTVYTSRDEVLESTRRAQYGDPPFVKFNQHGYAKFFIGLINEKRKTAGLPLVRAEDGTTPLPYKSEQGRIEDIKEIFGYKRPEIVKVQTGNSDRTATGEAVADPNRNPDRRLTLDEIRKHKTRVLQSENGHSDTEISIQLLTPEEVRQRRLWRRIMSATKDDERRAHSGVVRIGAPPIPEDAHEGGSSSGSAPPVARRGGTGGGSGGMGAQSAKGEKETVIGAIGKTLGKIEVKRNLQERGVALGIRAVRAGIEGAVEEGGRQIDEWRKKKHEGIEIIGDLVKAEAAVVWAGGKAGVKTAGVGAGIDILTQGAGHTARVLIQKGAEKVVVMATTGGKVWRVIAPYVPEVKMMAGRIPGVVGNTVGVALISGGEVINTIGEYSDGKVGRIRAGAKISVELAAGTTAVLAGGYFGAVAGTGALFLVGGTAATGGLILPVVAGVVVGGLVLYGAYHGVKLAGKVIIYTGEKAAELGGKAVDKLMEVETLRKGVEGVKELIRIDKEILAAGVRRMKESGSVAVQAGRELGRYVKGKPDEYERRKAEAIKNGSSIPRVRAVLEMDKAILKDVEDVAARTLQKAQKAGEEAIAKVKEVGAEVVGKAVEAGKKKLEEVEGSLQNARGYVSQSATDLWRKISS